MSVCVSANKLVFDFFFLKFQSYTEIDHIKVRVQRRLQKRTLACKKEENWPAFKDM